MRTARPASSPPLPASPFAAGSRWPGRAVPAAVAAGAVALRFPALLAVRHLSFDDGVYGASAVALRTGALPFREVFSSQGPLFLPLVWLVPSWHAARGPARNRTPAPCRPALAHH